MEGNDMKKLKYVFPLLALIIVSVVCSIGFTTGRLVHASESEGYDGPFSGYSTNSELAAWKILAANASANDVMKSAPQITVLTHGLGADASAWSNDGASFAKDNDSILSKLDTLAGGASLYWAKMVERNPSDSFYLYDLNEQIHEPDYDKDFNVQKINDISKHIVVVFEAYAPDYHVATGSNDAVYAEFEYMLNKICYDVWLLNGKLFPKINLIGHSRGGLTNLQYALNYPNLVDSVFSLGTPYFGSRSFDFAKAYNISFGMDFNEQGYIDIGDKSLQDKYFNEWNNNYDSKYKHINYHALGGYSTVDFLSESINEVAGTKFNKFTLWLASLITFPIVDIWSLGAQVFGTADTLSALLQDIGYDNFGDFLIFRKTFFNDVLVHLDSQLGQESKSQTYKGFKRYSKRFTADNANIDKMAQPSMPSVVHNLETYDETLVNYILAYIKVGSNRDDTFWVTGNRDVDQYGNKCVTVMGYMGNAHEFVIPEVINGKTVTQIGASAFADNFYGKNVTSVTLPSTLRIIGVGAFENCTELRTINFSGANNLIALDHGAFRGTTQLQNFD
jgi:pimeloyl-ACP methyl ester carboxylesterase